MAKHSPEAAHRQASHTESIAGKPCIRPEIRWMERMDAWDEQTEALGAGKTRPSHAPGCLQHCLAEQWHLPGDGRYQVMEGENTGAALHCYKLSREDAAAKA
eukprot:857283-Pelagomonas_calceolata.AAC.1